MDDAKKRVRKSVRNKRGRSTGRAEGSLRTVMSGNRVAIVGGKKRVPYYGWLDFGGRLRAQGGRRNEQYRPRKKKGRYIYPAIDAKRKVVAKAADKAIVAANSKAFHERGRELHGPGF